MNQHEKDDTSAGAAQRVLVIDDEDVIGQGCRRALTAVGYEVEVTSDARTGLEAALSGGFDVLLVDLRMPYLGGMDILRRARAAGVQSEIVIITGHSTVEDAVRAMKEGAADFLAKPFTPDELRLVVKKVCERSALLRENAALRRELGVDRGLEGIIGESRPMERVFSLIKRVAPTDGTVLITGESGTGKEMVVRAIHRLSRRQDKPLLACDCSALAPSLLESELFGHVKGSFTGATANKQGLFEAAHHGTLFLDEVANISLETQGKLLRALETRRIKRVGDTVDREVDIRLVAATNRVLSTLVESNQFREDLYYRLNVVPIELPPLRDRHGDIPRLANAFLERARERHQVSVRGFTHESMALMESYRWPGNVRELRNIVERIAILCEAERIEPRHLPPEIQTIRLRTDLSELPERWDDFRQLKARVREAAVHELERRFLTAALERSGYNVSKAAENVGMQRTLFHSLMRKHQITPSPEP